METPLYKLYFFRRTPSYYDLSEADWNQLRADITAQQRILGIRDLFNAEMAWSNERFEYFGVEFHPSLEATQAYTRCLQHMNYYKYIEGETFLGIPMDNVYPDFTLEPPTPDETPIYRIYLARETAYARQLPPDALATFYDHTREAFHRSGAKNILSAYMRWNNEAYEYFAIERFPSMEALIGYTQFLSSNNWYQITEARSYLGTAFSGLVSGVTNFEPNL